MHDVGISTAATYETPGPGGLPGRDAPPPGSPEGGPSCASDGLLDRAGEQDRLDRLLARAAAGHGSSALVVGEPGIGKTSLLQALTSRAREDGWTVLTGRGSPLEGGFGHGLVRQLLVDRAGPDPSTGATGLDPEVAVALFAPHRRPRKAPAVAEFAVLHALGAWFLRQAGDRPLLVTVDDAQWADPESLRFLNFLALRLPSARVALVVAGRPPTEAVVAELLDGLLTTGAAELVSPGPLSRVSVERLVRRGLDDPRPGLVEACARASAGNPLLLTLLVRALAEHGTGGAEPADRLVERLAPDAVRAHLGALLGGRSADLRRLAEAIAVAGPRLPVAQACALAGLDGPGLDGARAEEAVQGLLDLRLVDAEDGLVFRHPLLATAVRHSMTLAARERLERRVADLPPAPEPPAALGVDALTPTERRVAGLLVQDLSNRQVARSLYVTEKTVEYHVTNIFKKVGAHSRHELSRALAAA